MGWKAGDTGKAQWLGKYKWLKVHIRNRKAHPYSEHWHCDCCDTLIKYGVLHGADRNGSHFCLNCVKPLDYSED